MSEILARLSSNEELERLKSDAVEQSKSQLQAYLAEQSAFQRARFAEDARHQDKFRDILFEQLQSHDAELKQLAADERRFIERRGKLIPPSSLLIRGERPRARFPADVASATRGAPYDEVYTLQGGQGNQTADKNTGIYDLAVQSIGNGHQKVGAGIGFWFHSTAGNPGQRFSATVDFSYDWWDSAAGYVAHNDVRTWLTVWGMSENGWVVTSADQQPSWSDGVGWYERHGNNQSGTSVCSAVFNARPNSMYFCWVQSSADAYADSGILGDAASSIHLHCKLQLAVFD